MKSNACYEPYPEYKPSGLAWTNGIPIHWNTLRLRNVVDMRVSNVDKHIKDGEMSVRLCNYVDVYKNERITDDIPFMRATATVNEIDRFRLQLGDVLITKDSETWDDIGVPAVVDYAASDLICGYHLAVLRPMKSLLDGSFLHRVLQSSIIGSQFHVSASGVTRYGLTHEAIKSVLLPLPPLDEQASIARYLDRADDLIRRAINAKERLIELLTEQRQATIHRAVTRGLDPNVRLKDSGVEWLGDVPEHWEVRRLKTLCNMKSGDGITAESIEPSGEYPVYGGNGLRGHTSAYTHDGDFVLIGRQGALCGNVHIARSKFWASEHAVVATLAVPHVVEWFAATLDVMNLNQYSISAAQPGLTVERVLNLSLPVPPNHEQIRIAHCIGKATADIDTAIDKAQRQIDLLREYHMRLIADVVTGQVDVRGAVGGEAELPVS